MRITVFSTTLIFLLTLPSLASAGVTYLPGPTYNETFEPGVQHPYTLPEIMNEKCGNIDCKYVTNLDDNIGYCMFGRGEDMLLSITITNGSASTYTINVSTWEFSPSEITITIGSTLIFNVTDNTTLHNIALPWSTPAIEEEVNKTPGFEFNISSIAIILALLFIKKRS